MSAPALPRPTSTPPSAIDIAIEYLTDRRACQNCSHPVNNTGSGDTWVHTETGLYRCPIGSAGTFAEPADGEDEIAERIDQACQDHEEAVRESIYNAAFDEGADKGREEMYGEAEEAIDEELNALFAQIERDDVELTPDLVRQAIDIALNRVCP